MTISSRAWIYRACLILSVVFAAAGLFAASRMGTGLFTAARRLPGFDSPGGGDSAAGLVPLLSVALCSLYGIGVLSFLSFRYSRTVSMEFFFFVFWALSLAVEPLRVESLRGALWGASFFERNIVTRLLLSARFLGSFSLFAGSLYSAGFNSERQEITLSLVLLLSLAFGTALPVNTGTFGPDLLQRIGYGSLNNFIYIACFLGACADYLLAVRITGEKGYRAVALGCALTFFGGMALRDSHSMSAVILGTLALAFGTVLFLRRIHAYYLWQ